LGVFGEKLRRQREQHGIALDSISNTTNISTGMLRALEDEHFDQLPGGVCNKGFVRAYARQVGLNEEETVADYLASLGNQIQAPSALPDLTALPAHDVLNPHLPGNDLPGNGNHRSHPLLNIDRRKQGRRNFDRRNEDRRNEGRRHLAEALLLVTVALLLWNSFRHRAPTAAPLADTSTQSPAPAPVTGPASRTAQSRSKASLGVDKVSSAGTLSSGKLSGGTISAASQAEPTAGSAAAIPPSKLTLLIRAEETARVSIMADGKPVAQEILIAPAHTSVRASREIVVKTGNAAGVSFLLNGTEIPAQGKEGEVKTYVFGKAGVRVIPQTPLPGTNR